MAQHRNEDRCVIYYSGEDECWIAHSLRTDQIGTGDCIINALADLLLAIKQILEVAADDPTVAVYREAPPKIRQMIEKAKTLPGEMYDIAHKKVHGEWPKELEPNFKTRGRRPPKFRANIRQVAAG